MSGRIAHRPHYRSKRPITPPNGNTRQTFFYTRWSYKHQTPFYQKHPLGYHLSLLPLGYYGIHAYIWGRTGL